MKTRKWMPIVFITLCLLLIFNPVPILASSPSVSPNESVTVDPKIEIFNSESALDGTLYKSDGSYPPTDINIIGSGLTVGQIYFDGFFMICRGYVSFDTSSIPDHAVITNATLKLKTAHDSSAYDFTMRVMGGSQPIYGSSFETDDWDCGTTEVATWSSSQYPGDGIYVNITIPTHQINKTGRTQFELISDKEGTPPTGAEYVDFYSGDFTGDEPKLEITWLSPPETPSRPTVPQTKAYQVSAVSDDCRKDTYEKNGVDYNFNTIGSYILAGTYYYYYQTYYESGMRFTNLDIPPESTILSARLKLCAWSNTSGTTVNTRITGEATGNSASFTNLSDYDGRTRTSAYADWDDIPPWYEGTWYTSPDLKDIIQEIINRADWNSGNALSLFWADHGSTTGVVYCYRTATAYDYSAANAPKLEITFLPSSSKGSALTTYTYYTSTTDPDGDDVRYQFDWDDGSNTTTGWYASGDTASASHAWSAVGIYNVKVRAQDIHGLWSGWSDPHTVDITGSCPFIYSWDGQQYHFEHEAYPFAVMKSAETTSYDRLKYLKEVDGEYKLKIEQVLYEKDWMDSFELYVVDHPGEDSFVMPDLQGNLHTIKELIQPVSAYEKNGDDCLEEVKYLDDKTWKDSIFDADVNDESTLRNWVVLTFPKPEGATEAKLMFSVKKQMTITQGWLLFINLIGENYWNLWQKIMENPTLTKLAMEMVEREVNLKIEVWNGTEWIRQDSLSAGDSLWDDFLAVLDISDIEGDELQVRLYFTTSDYEINYVGIDYSEDEPMIVHKIDPYYAVKNGEEDVLAALEKPDETYVTLVPNDVIELRYEAPPESEWKRDFTIATKGYYNFVDFQKQTFSGFLEGIKMWLKAMTEPYFVTKTVIAYLQGLE